jgi:hypothetical protein
MVLLYGQSLLLSGVAKALAKVPGLQVARARTWTDAGRMLAEKMPDVLIFDLKGTCEGHVLPLLLENPHPTMVGLDTEQNQAVLLSGRAADPGRRAPGRRCRRKRLGEPSSTSVARP